MSDTDRERDRERFVRWQQITLQQLSYAINLVLIFAGAVIGFVINAALSERTALTAGEKGAFLSALILLALSVLLGLSAVVTRLFDFRYTTQTARLDWQRGDAARSEQLRRRTDILGAATWCFFKLQLILFALGAIIAAIVFYLFIAAF